jgi:hypothetical protein
VYFPTPNALFGPGGAFLPYCWWGHESSWTGATAEPTPIPIRKVFALFLLGGLEGRSALQGKRAFTSPRLPCGRPALLFLRSTGITGGTSCYVLLSLETLVHLASLLRRTGKCAKAYREVRFSVPGSASGRTGKCAIAYREVRFEKRDTQPVCGRLYREVL